MGQPHAGTVANAGWSGRRVSVVRVSECVGAGKPLFAPDAGLQPMRFLEAKHYDSGVIVLRYAPEGPSRQRERHNVC